MHYHNHILGRPCLHCHPHSYIRTVQHLIERCLLLHMSRDECINALAHHASITPLITLTGSIDSSINQCFNIEGVVVEEIRKLMFLLHISSINHVLRDGNKAAHSIAVKVAREQGRFSWLEVEPPWLMSVILDDMPLIVGSVRDMSSSQPSSEVFGTRYMWRELQKENRHFFQAYFHSISPTRGSPLIMRSHIQTRQARFAGRKPWK